jgi:hypothetical protein
MNRNDQSGQRERERERERERKSERRREGAIVAKKMLHREEIKKINDKRIKDESRSIEPT